MTVESGDTAREAPAQIAARIEDDGWAVMRGVVPLHQIEQLRDAVERSMDSAETPFGGNVFLGHHTRRLFNLLAHDPAFVDVPLHAPVLDVAEGVLDEDLLLSSLTAVEIHPGQDPQPLHADDGSIPVPRPHPPLALVANWPLTEFTEVNGGTRLVTRSHLAARRPDPGEEAVTVTAEMSPGDVLVYNGSLWHGGGANHSASRRVFIVCNYCAGWLRQEENQLLGVAREQVDEFPSRLRRLMGYGVFHGLQGHVAGIDPGSWFDESVSAELVWNRMR